jgi:predicted  nucleic acid-binding Zn-ribbon protein
VDAAEKDLKAKEAKVKAEEGTIRSAAAAMQADLDKIVADQTAKKATRDEFAATVPPALASRYDAIRKRGGLAIVALVNNTCSGCRMKLTPNKVNDIKKAKAMIVCDSCSRILYVPQEESAGASTETNPVSAS